MKPTNIDNTSKAFKNFSNGYSIKRHNLFQKRLKTATFPAESLITKLLRKGLIENGIFGVINWLKGCA
ncbi:MAG TPA: hypothetical protein VGK06_12970 [Methanosarcina sp.]